MSEVGKSASGDGIKFNYVSLQYSVHDPPSQWLLTSAHLLATLSDTVFNFQMTGAKVTILLICILYTAEMRFIAFKRPRRKPLHQLTDHQARLMFARLQARRLATARPRPPTATPTITTQRSDAYHVLPPKNHQLFRHKKPLVERLEENINKLMSILTKLNSK